MFIIAHSIAEGPFTMRHMTTILPFVDPIVVICITGQQLLDALEAGVSLWPALDGRFPQVSGIKFVFYHRVLAYNCFLFFFVFMMIGFRLIRVVQLAVALSKLNCWRLNATSTLRKRIRLARNCTSPKVTMGVSRFKSYDCIDTSEYFAFVLPKMIV